MVNLGGATENDRKKIVITKDSKVFFHNNVDYCVGTRRMGLALTEEYQEELRLVQKEIGFKHIRGHGLFCDDMAIFQTYEEDGKVRVEYNYTYLDRVMDAYKKVGLRPFLELGFMPKKLASGSQTIFYWQGNTTPPKDYDIDDDFKRFFADVRKHRAEMDIKITPSAREDVDLLAVAEELIREDFYADDYVDSTMKLISDNIFYETVKLNYIELVRSILR